MLWKEKVPRTVPAVNVFISEPHRTLPERQLAGRSEIGQLLSWLDPSSLQAFHSQDVLTRDWLCSLASALAPFHFYLFWFLAETVWEFLNSWDPVSLLSSNYICAELVRHETSSNKRDRVGVGCPLTCVVCGYFASSRLFVRPEFF